MTARALYCLVPITMLAYFSAPAMADDYCPLQLQGTWNGINYYYCQKCPNLGYYVVPSSMSPPSTYKPCPCGESTIHSHERQVRLAGTEYRVRPSKDTRIVDKVPPGSGAPGGSADPKGRFTSKVKYVPERDEVIEIEVPATGAKYYFRVLVFPAQKFTLNSATYTVPRVSLGQEISAAEGSKTKTGKGEFVKDFVGKPTTDKDKHHLIKYSLDDEDPPINYTASVISLNDATYGFVRNPLDPENPVYGCALVPACAAGAGSANCIVRKSRGPLFGRCR